MKLQIITPLKTHYKEIDWIELNTSSGNYVILNDHAPMILTLIPHSSISYGLKTGKQEIIKVARAMVHVNRDSVILLGDL